MDGDFNWLRILLGMGLLIFCFGILPSFFLWRDQRAKRLAKAKGEAQPLSAAPRMSDPVPTTEDRHARVGR